MRPSHIAIHLALASHLALGCSSESHVSTPPLLPAADAFSDGSEAAAPTVDAFEEIDATPAPSDAGTTIPTRPNIVFILLDDLDQLITPYWEAMTLTGALLRDPGLTFEQSFSPNPICCPARATLLTGLCSHNTGVLTNKSEFGGWTAFRHPLDETGNPMVDGSGHLIDNETRTVGVYLQQAGYRTAMIGKYLNGYDGTATPPGWTDWHVFATEEGKGEIPGGSTYYTGYNYFMAHSRDGSGTEVKKYGEAETDYGTDVVRDEAVDFVRRSKGEPFFMVVAPTAPHGPLKAAPRHASLVPQWVGKLPKRPNYNEEDLSDKAEWLQKAGPALGKVMAIDASHDLWDTPESTYHKMYFLFPEAEFPNRMGSLYAVDELVVDLVEEVAAAGELDRTLFFFAGDNGYNQGAHRLFEKQTPYEEALRVPLVVTGPGVRAGVSQAMVTQQDYAPTFFELAGIPIPDHVNGRSFVPVLQQPLAIETMDRDLLIENRAAGGEVEAEVPYPLEPTQTKFLRQFIPPSYRGLRTRTHTFIEWYWNEPHELELYDLTQDPFQLDNLLATPAGQAQHAPLVEKFQDRLDQLRNCVGKDCL